MIAYADSSFIVSLYSQDANSEQALLRVERAQPRLIYSTLTGLETTNALNLRLFRKQLSEDLRDGILNTLRRDIEKGVLLGRTVDESAFELAIRLSQRWTSRFGSRASDLLHVAIALEAHAAAFLSFDRRQLDIARSEGLKL